MKIRVNKYKVNIVLKTSKFLTTLNLTTTGISAFNPAEEISLIKDSIFQSLKSFMDVADYINYVAGVFVLAILVGYVYSLYARYIKPNHHVPHESASVVRNNATP